MTKSLGTVMIVDDEDIDQRQYKRLLERSGTTQRILQFSYADDALAWLTDNPTEQVDLIFLDVNIPRMNGFDFLEAAHEQLSERVSSVIIMLTTSLNPADRERAQKYGMVRAFFNKPLTAEHLLKAAHVLRA